MTLETSYLGEIFRVHLHTSVQSLFRFNVTSNFLYVNLDHQIKINTSNFRLQIFVFRVAGLTGHS